MFELIAILVAIIGSSLAAAWDLKTTEIPDEIAYVMVILGLLLAILQSIWEKSYTPMLKSVYGGFFLLGVGFLFYYFGQWGGGDAELLGAIGFLLPQIKKETFLPFPLTYLLNVFLLGAAYIIIYAIVLTCMNRRVASNFVNYVKKSRNVMILGFVVLFFTFFLVNYLLLSYFHLNLEYSTIIINSLIPAILALITFLTLKLAKIVEEIGFKKKIPVSKLKVGDVLESSRFWRGITKEELKKIKRLKKGDIVIKEGVRFGPTFPIALLFTLYFGDGILLLLKFLY